MFDWLVKTTSLASSVGRGKGVNESGWLVGITSLAYFSDQVTKNLGHNSPRHSEALAEESQGLGQALLFTPVILNLFQNLTSL